MSRALRIATASACLALAVASWFFTWDDTSEHGFGVFGGYRDRWFLFNLFVTWLAGIAVLVLVIKPRRPVWLRLVSVHLGFIFALAALELPALVGAIDYRDLFPRARRYYQGEGKSIPGLRTVMPANMKQSGMLSGDLVPILGAPAKPVEYTFQTDSRGLRNASEKNDPSILLLGDSILVAGLLPIEQIVSERLERELGVEVLNVSASGDSLQEELLRLRSLDLDLDGRLVVQFIFEGNDQSDSAEWRAWLSHQDASEYPESGIVKTVLAMLHAPRRSAGRRRSGVYTTADGLGERVYFLNDAARIDSHRAEFPVIADALREARRDLDGQGARYALVFVPAKLTVLGPQMTWDEDSALSDTRLQRSLFRDDMRQFAEREELPYFDTTEALQAAARQGVLPYFCDDTHLNGAGHGLVARTLAPWLRQLLDSRPKSSSDAWPSSAGTGAQN
jgi:hypothetical protein